MKGEGTIRNRHRIFGRFEQCLKRHEYEYILFAFLALRFLFKNTLNMSEYFTEEPVFGFSDALNIVVGTLTVITVCAALASVFGRLIRRNGEKYKDSVTVLTALFFACPVTLPFLFGTSTGTRLLYPFALFVFAVYLCKKPVVRWLLPFICALYFIPALFSDNVLFAALQEDAVIYTPLLILLLLFDSVESTVNPNRDSPKKGNKPPIHPEVTGWLFRVSSAVCIGCFLYSRSSRFGSSSGFFSGLSHSPDLTFLLCALLAFPALAAVTAVIIIAFRPYQKIHLLLTGIGVPAVFFYLLQDDACRRWLPFVTIALFVFVLDCVWKGNAAVLIAVEKVSLFFWKRKFLLFLILLVTMTLSNTSTVYSSEFLREIFNNVPY